MKLYLVGIKGEVGKCSKVLYDVAFQMREAIKEIGEKNIEKIEFRKHANPYGTVAYGFEGDMIGKACEEVLPLEMTINEDFIATIGPGYKHPNYDAMHINLLMDAKKEVKLLVDDYRKTWEEVGCTLMVDGWINTSHRPLINFLVYCPKGFCFLKSMDALDVVKDAFTLFKLFEKMVLWVGPNNIVHVVIDNGTNYKAIGRMLSEKYKSITWSPCAAHCINLILNDIVEMNHIVNLAKRAYEVTKFVYNHLVLLAWLRKRQGWTEIVRSGATRFATTFIALRNLHEHKHTLQAMLTNRFFVGSRYARSHKGKEVIPIILDYGFWDGMGMIVDSDDKPAIGYVYDGMYRARLRIKKLFKYKKTLYKPYTNIIKQRWDKLLRRDIHLAAYFLNPAFQHDEASFCKKLEVMSGLLDVIERKASMFNREQVKVSDDSRIFRDREESFSREHALQTSITI
ncbi:uncharacterized protein LOC116113087 [Pistacia vera]|uniref:uncharacterized protein LOC116113087 n=1 Tax=Pistacia vera TaxID=55513 RepID=UPI001263653B|nr:uncharacterized protein LOC116113087 [Pistacia vera]